MGIMADLRRAFAPLPVPLEDHWRIRQTRLLEQRTHARTIADMDLGSSTVSDLLLRSQGLRTRPWQAASVKEALGTPAIFRAVTLITSTTSSLAVEAYRNGALLSDERTPSLVKRPDPFRIPRDFYRDTVYDYATRGEFWWWKAARDGDGNVLSLIRVPPWEMTVTPTDDRLRPTLKWFDREMRREDMVQGTFLLDESGYRGVGPLQLCGAAVSVAVEAQEWAANFYAEGGRPGTIVHTRGDLGDMSEEDMAALKAQFNESPNNTTKFVDEGIDKVEEHPVDVAGAQMLEARHENKGDAANMFGIPGALLEYGRPGSSLTYQNVGDLFTVFVKSCLVPLYLTPIEQHLSDLLPRSTTAHFNVEGFERADAKTRWEIYNLALTVLGQTEAAQLAREGEGLVAGDPEFRPIPFAPPQAIPTRLPITGRTSGQVRCDGKRLLRGLIKPCGKLLAESGPFIGTCPRCGKEHTAAA